MKRIIPILIVLLFSNMAHSQQQNSSYTELWNEVQKLENEALTKSALKVVRSISEKAKKEKNAPQIVKALIYTSKYAQILEEDAQLNIVRDFKQEIVNNTFPASNVLHSYLANLYWQYFQQNRYQFYNRSRTSVKVDSTDFRTWDLNTLFKEIELHFQNSLEQPGKLQRIKVTEFDALLNKQENSENYRPTLFDLLAHGALEFYKSDENAITRPADIFKINDPAFLCEAEPYSSLEIVHPDETSLPLKALRVYQELIRFHLADQYPDALVDADLERLRFLYSKAVFENKELLYEEVLRNSATSYQDLEVSALYSYEIAKLYNEMANRFQPGISKDHQWKRKEALELCEKVISDFPKSIGAAKCRVLKAEILNRDLQLAVEQHLPVNRPSKILLKYRNLDELQLSAYKISRSQLKKLNDIYPIEKQLPYIQDLKLAQQWTAKVRNEKDYQNHSTELLVPNLDNGDYIILAMSKDDGKSFAFAHTQITNLALLESRTTNAHNFQLINRNNGQPIAKANLELHYRKSYNKPRFRSSYITDKSGRVSVPLPGASWTDIDILATAGKEKAHFGTYYISRRSNSRSLHKTNYSAFLFTDRSIYRPGQAVYFKGIAVKKTDEDSTVPEGIKVQVSLKDVNGQQLGEQELITNEFGSFKGEFMLPNNGLTGNYSIQVASKGLNLSGYTSISVEEYKRPKFETSFDPVSETYKVNDDIVVKGKAKAYAGSTITDAKVVYRVKRIVHFPRWYYYSRPYFNSSPQEITHGETITDTSGNYEINFKAIPDLSVSKEDLPVFTYEISADVTDINGETRSTSTTVRVGYHALTAVVSLPNQLNKEEKAVLKISTSNLNGEFVPAEGSIKIYKLIAPNYVLRKRPWPAPDYKSFTKEKFKELFPYEAFDEEDKISKWEKGRKVWEGNFDTGASKEISLTNLRKWESGNYIIELETRDKFNQVVKDKAQTYLFSSKDKQLADNQLFDIKTDKTAYKVGEEATLTLASAGKDLFVTLLVEKNRTIIDHKVLPLSENKSSLDIPIHKEDLGGFTVHYSFSAYNSFYSGSISIAVPYPSTQLEIETLTFRDKLQPGTEELWTFKIKGPKGDKVAAEVLAGMYDASLDAFKGHSWSFNPLHKPNYYSYAGISGQRSFGTQYFRSHMYNPNRHTYPQQYYDSFDPFGLYFGYGRGIPGNRRLMRSAAPDAMLFATDEMELEEVAVEGDVAFAAETAPRNKKEEKLEGAVRGLAPEENSGDETQTTFDEVQIRKNLQETAFFFPQLRTDEEGNVTMSFTSPEALTRWKIQLLAHTKTLESATQTLETVTQKELMVLPNPPRFLREGDELSFSTKIANLTEQLLRGEARLELTDALTGLDISSELLGSANQVQQDFAVDSLGNSSLSWRLKIPESVQAVQYKVIAKAGDFGDGEQNVLPVLTNRMLVTETLPMWVRSNQQKKFVLGKLRDNTSTSLRHHQLTLEMTSNPAWYAVQALPYLMEYPYECNEQMFSRYYANTLATHIANSNPRIQEVFEQWANTDALLSNLEKNQELKSLLIQETPWLRDAQSETEQKKRIALLFNLNKMRDEQAGALRKLADNQMGSGAWAWFKGGRANRYITQHIITGLGHLEKLGVDLGKERIGGRGTTNMVRNAIAYLDREFVAEYEHMKKYTKDLNKDHLSSTQIHYLYMRSFFKDFASTKKVKEIEAYYLGQAKKYWMNKNLYTKGLLGLSLHRRGESSTASKILKSLRENSITNEELGMYWKENTSSWYWYQAPIETQALMIEAFSEIDGNITEIDNLKIWLLKNKQTNQWKTTKATTEAVYALLLQGSDWLSIDDAVTVLIGGETIAPTKLEDTKVEAGTGYFKTSWKTDEISPKMAEIELSKQGAGVAWGAMYWQYFEDLDKITSAETPLKLKKKLFLKKNTATGEEITAISDQVKLKVGDLLRVRIELRADRPMEFVHMKDMRASGLEPINVLSSYKWQDGLGYYESTKDASTNFFFDYLPKGVFVFEYDLRVNNAGDFSNGITTIQSMYAPEFSSHSEGVRVSVGSRQ
ncbi:MAG: alpha-2-macroglobulin [Flavobacteriaceae bacterium]